MDEEPDTSLSCPAGEAMRLCFIGQFAQDRTTAVLPAKPCGQVFWIKRARARRTMIGLIFGIISI